MMRGIVLEGGQKMTTQCDAVYEKGILRPSIPLPLREGEQVNVIIYQRSSENDTGNAAEILARIAALPTAGGDPSTSQEHDRILYGEDGVS